MELNAVHVSQFYPCSHVKLAAELLYICELGKHSYYKYGKPVSIECVKLNEILQKSKVWDYFRISVKCGWVVDIGNLGSDFLDFTARRPRITTTEFGSFLFTIDPTDHIDGIDTQRIHYDDVYALSNPQYRLVYFYDRNDTSGVWCWDINMSSTHFTDNNSSLNNNNANVAWVSFVAMCAVYRLFNNNPRAVSINFTSQVLSNNKMAISYFLLLAEETPCFSSWTSYSFNDTSITSAKVRQYGYYAWYAKGKDLGYLCKDYTLTDKVNRIIELDMRTGDFCFFYERKRSQKRDLIKEIESCRLGRIKKITTRSISLEFITTLRTKAHGWKTFKQMTTSVQSLWSDSESYNTLHRSEQTFSLIDVGIEYCMSGEIRFITPLDSTSDSVEMWVSDKDILRLSQNDLIYWVCKDYNYDFDEKRFKAKFFPKSEPLYDKYMRGDEIDEALYVR